MLWVFCTPNKRPPLEIIDYFLHMIKCEGIQPHTIRVDEDGALARSSKFTDFLLLHHITLDTMGGYNSWLNGMIECPSHTIAKTLGPCS
jgi:hypothetical protein